MSNREIQAASVNDRGDEVHPGFGQISVHRIQATPGKSLFDSEIRHGTYVQISIDSAVRRRELNRDWIYPGRRSFIEVSMSESQWAALVSSFGSQGTPCTIDAVYPPDGLEDGSFSYGRQPEIPFEPRLALSASETRGAADKAFAKIKEAMVEYKTNKTAANLRILEAAIANSTANVEYAAKTMTEHVENVVTKAKSDIEAMVDTRARQLGVDHHQVLVSGALNETHAIEGPEEDSE